MTREDDWEALLVVSSSNTRKEDKPFQDGKGYTTRKTTHIAGNTVSESCTPGASTANENNPGNEESRMQKTDDEALHDLPNI